MKQTIRKGIFETASSAVHALAIASDGLEPCHIPIDVEGYITINFAAFPEWDEGITTFDQEIKLSYIATECYYLNHWDKNIDDNYAWQCVCKAVCKYSGAEGIRVNKSYIEPELNHQVIPEYDLRFCSYWDDDSIVNFVFNKYVGIKMTHD